MERRRVPRGVCWLLALLLSPALRIINASKVLDEVPLAEEAELDWRHSRLQRYLGESDDEDFVSSAGGSGDYDGSGVVPTDPTPKRQTAFLPMIPPPAGMSSVFESPLYYRVMVNFTKSIEYNDALEDFNSERFREVSEAIIDTLESQFIRIPGEQTVTVVLIQKVAEDIIVQLDVGSEGNNNDQQIEDVVYSMASSGSFGPYQSSPGGFQFRRLGAVDLGHQCQKSDFMCKSGECIHRAYVCDGQPDCADMSDEIDVPSEECALNKVVTSTIRPGIPTIRPTSTRTQLRTPATQTRTLTPFERPPFVVSTRDYQVPRRPCSTDQAVCQSGQCIPRDYLCDGERDCEDGSDELDCGTQSPCEPNEFKCRNGRCALKLWRCDGDTDCADGSDEEYCPTRGPGDMCAPEQFVCVSSRTCIPASYQCDEEPDCPDRSDEFGCTSPQVVTLPEETVQTTRGATVTLTCAATGVPTPIITWRLNWGHIPVSSRISMTSQNGQGTLIIRDVKESDQGAYTCEAINAKGMIFAIPDAVLILKSNSGNCPGGQFSVDGSQRCLPCFCFGVTKICDATGRYQTQISLRFNEEDDFKGVRVTVPALSATPPLSTSQILVDTDSAELQLVDLSRRFLNHDSFWTLPRQFLGNKIDSYGGFLRYKIRYSLGRGQSEPENKADVIIVGNGKKLIYRVQRPSQPSVTNQKEIQFIEDHWQHKSGGAVTREDLMMALVNLENIMIRAKYDNRMASVGLSDVAMDTSSVEFTRLGKAQMVEECRCPAGYTGLSCETCATGFNRIQTSPYLGTCNGCSCNGHATTCDKVTGHCLSCQHNTEGSRCDKCRAGYFGNPTQGTLSDCMPCPCPFTGPHRRFSSTCFLDTDGRPTCDACAKGYTGRRCERCASGYEGNPMIEGGDCKQVGFLTKCDDKGTDPTAPVDGSCQCKLNVIGRLCNKCSPGSFHLDAANAAGCLKCFCMGVSQQCESSTWHRDQVQAALEHDQALYTLTNAANTLQIAEGIRISGVSELTFGDFGDIPQDIYYWVLPDRFKGDKVTSYGGELRYIILHRVSPRSSPVTGQPDVVLQGNNIFLEHRPTNRPQPGVPTTFTVPLRESAWRRTDGQPCSREHLLMALADINLLMIRATFAEKMLETRISKIRMDTAVPHYTGQERAVEVEECICPQGYRGPSCQDCVSGYTRAAQGLYLGMCEPCNCFGHSNECDVETGKCLRCRDNTEGKHCEQCQPGFYGDAKGRTHSDCQACPCPGTTDSNQFSRTCFLDSDGRPTCDNCRSGYGGRNCERCAPGYTGNPIYGQPCTQAGCTCDRRGSASEHCDGTGICQCKPNVEGRNCNTCRSGFFFLNAGNRDGCLHCFCMGITQQCRSSTYYRDTVVTPFLPPSNFQNFALVNRQRTTKITSGFTVEITNGEPLLSFGHFGPESYFWQLPEPYRGDKKDPSLTEVQLRKDAIIWQILDSSSSHARSKRSSQSSSDLEEQKRIDDEIWAIITGFTSQQDNHTPSPASTQNLSLSSLTLGRPGPIGPPAPSASHTTSLHSLTSSSRVAVSHSSQPSSLFSSSGQYARPSATQYTEGRRDRHVPSSQPQQPTNLLPSSTLSVRAAGFEKYALVYKGFSLLPENHFYWKLPHHYLGNKVASYGGRLKYTLSYNAGYRALPVPDSDVQITGNDITLVANHREHLLARETKTFEIIFKEQLWKRPDGQAATREHLLMVLADLDEILIRATFTTDMISASIGGVSMETAVAAYTSQLQAQEVEECRCPAGYTGLSCQDCAPGYTRTGGGLYLGHCELCECNGHSESCHPETRVCSGCLHGTTGEFCDSCAAGYYGDATAGTPEDCLPCACPLSSQQNQFSPTCESTGAGGYRCTSCSPGYTGQYCERCAVGYTGNPSLPGQSCLPFDRIPLLIRIVPERVTVHRGGQVQLKCQVSGQAPYYYSWTRGDGRPLSRRVIQRNRGEELLIREIEPSDAGVYLCVCRNAQTTNSSQAEVVVSVPPFKAITVNVEEPKIQSVRPGVTVNFICTAKSQSPAYTLVWTRQLGGKLPDTAVDFNGILTIRNVRAEDAGGYVCTGSNMFAMDEGSAVLHVPATAQVRYQAYETLEGHRLSTAPSAPVAVIEPQILTVKQGQTAELRCTATGNPPPTLQWSGGQGSVISPNAVVQGGLLRIAAVESSDEAEYFCLAQNSAGDHTARTIIYVQSNGHLPQVQVSPQKIDVYEGEAVRLFCRAGGHPIPTLSWKKLGGELPTKAMTLFGFLHMTNGHNDEVSQKRIWELQARTERTDIGTLIIPSIAAAHGGVYLCIGSNSAGSSEGRIEVTVITAHGSPPRVRVHPSPASVTEGESLELMCQARGQPEPTVTWHRAGGSLTTNHQVLGSRLRIVQATAADAGDYSCQAENSLGRERATVSVSVASRSTPHGSPPRVRVHPSPASVTEGESLELMCQARGQPEPTVTWHRAGGSLTANHQVFGSRLRIVQATAADAGDYSCQAENSLGRERATVSVSVASRSTRKQSPIISTGPQEVTVIQGHNVTMKCEIVGGAQPLRIEWITPSQQPQDNVHITGEGTTITITNAHQNSHGQYKCVAGNRFGLAYSTVTLIVQGVPTVSISPGGPVRLGVRDSITIECISMAEPQPVLRWHRIEGRQRKPLEAQTSQMGHSILKISSARVEDSGTYSCQAVNQLGSAESRVEVLVDLTPSTPTTPQVTVEEATSVATVGGMATLHCSATGYPTPVIQWSKLRAPLPWQHKILNGSLVIPNLGLQDSGQYICNASNSAGFKEIFIMLDVESPPYATFNNEAVTVRVGEVIRLQCLAQGTPPLQYQWSKLGGKLPTRARIRDGILQINLAAVSDSDTYHCLVTNKVGESKATATVRVRSPLAVRVTPQIDVKNIGGTVEFTCSVIGDPRPRIEWLKQGGHLPPNHKISKDVLRIMNVQQENEGIYICRATSGYEQAQDSAKLTIQALPIVMINVRTSVQTVMIGGSVEFECQAIGDPQPVVGWSKVEGVLPPGVLIGNGMLKIANVKVSDAGRYRCTATNQVGSVQSEVVLHVQTVPHIIPQPEIKEVTVGSAAVFPCLASGFPAPDVTWTKLEGDLPAGARVDNNVLTIQSATPEHTGTYVCTATNEQGTETAYAMLKVRDRLVPYFTQNPVSYIALPTIKDAYHKFEISITFRPDAADGMIMYNGQKKTTGADFISFGLVGGRPEFRYDVGSGMATIRHPNPVSLGEYHTVVLHRNLTQGSLFVDNKPPVNGTSQGSFRGLDLNEDLYVGGYPDFDNISKATGLDSGFMGCVRQLTIQGDEVIFSLPELRATGISNCPTCKDRPCKNGGNCIDSESSRYVCLCREGFTGSNCEHSQDLHCHPEACGPNATCVNNEDGLRYTCRCHLGKRGPKCMDGTLVTAPSFRGRESFVSYPALSNIHNELTIEMQFKPRSPTGLMFFSSGKRMKMNDFVSVALDHGFVEFRYDLGSGLAVLRSLRPVTLNKWHRLRAHRYNKEGSLHVDNESEVRQSSPGKSQGLNLRSPMYLGGVATSEALPKAINVTQGLIGCIAEVLINGKKVDLSYTFTASLNVDQCYDNFLCDRQPCLHGGTCLVTAESEYQCLCPQQYQGERCEIYLEPCSQTNPCMNGGTCKRNRCFCPMGFTGLECELDSPVQFGAFFHDEGYIALPRQMFPRSTPRVPETIEMKVRTRTSNGLLLWQGVVEPDSQEEQYGLSEENGENGKGKDYVALGLQNGHLLFSYQLGSGEANILSDVLINDGEWHKITAVREGKSGHIQMDEDEVVRGESTGDKVMVNTKGSIYLGGAPDIKTFTGGKFTSGITGCIRDLLLLNQRPDQHHVEPIDLQVHAEGGVNAQECPS